MGQCVLIRSVFQDLCWVNQLSFIADLLKDRVVNGFLDKRLSQGLLLFNLRSRWRGQYRQIGYSSCLSFTGILGRSSAGMSLCGWISTLRSGGSSDYGVGSLWSCSIFFFKLAYGISPAHFVYGA